MKRPFYDTLKSLSLFSALLWQLFLPEPSDARFMNVPDFTGTRDIVAIDIHKGYHRVSSDRLVLSLSFFPTMMDHDANFVSSLLIRTLEKEGLISVDIDLKCG